MEQIFISYSRKDEKFARWLAKKLQEILDVGIWIDVEDIEVGQKWSNAIQEGLDNAQVMVVIMTPSAMESVNVEDEWQYFLDQQKPVVPVLLKSTQVPYQLRRIQYVDFSLREEFPDAMRQLIMKLRENLKPLPGEAGVKGKQRARHGKKSRSHKEQKIFKEHHRYRNIIRVMAVLLFVAVLGIGGLAAFLLSNQISITIHVQEGVGDAQVLLPDSNQPVSVNSVETIPEGSQIITNGDVIRLESSDSNASAVIAPHSETSLENFSDEISLGLQTGSISLDTGSLAGGTVQTAYGVEIAVDGTNLDVGIDPENDDVKADCYVGSCEISDDTGKTRTVNSGESITFSGTERNFDTAEITQITGAIIFVSYRNGNAEIYAMKTDGTKQTNLTNNPNLDRDPVWSFDGRKIAFESFRDGNGEIYIMNADGTEPTNLTQNRSNDKEPTWSPDGTQIAFVSMRDGNEEIYIMNADGTNQVRLTDDRGTDSEPTWSPDGTRIAFVSTRDGNEEITIMNIDGTDIVNLTENDAPDNNPVWSPDGTQIAFTSRRVGSNLDIYAIDVNTRELTQLTDHSATDMEPAWSPDGTQIIFTSQRLGNNDIFSLVVGQPESAINLSSLTSTADEAPYWLPIIRPGT